MHSLKSFLDESQKHIDFHDNNIKRYDELILQNKNHLIHLNAQQQDVVLSIARATAPDFSEAELKKLSQLIHKATIVNFSSELEREISNTKARISEILADKEYLQREVLVHPTTGEYILEFNQINAVYQQIVQEFEPYQKYIFEFEDLITDKYDTPEYEHTGVLRFFNNEHLDNWRVGDILCKTFGVKRFSTLKEKYLTLQKEHTELFEATNHYQSKITYIEKIIAELEELQERLPNLPTIYYDYLKEELNGFFNSTSQEGILTFFQAYPELDILSKTQQGLNFQQQYLQDFQKKLVAEQEEILQKRTNLFNERSRYESNQPKYQNKQWSQEKFDKRFNRNHDYINKRFSKYEKTNSTIGNFKNYNTASNTLATVFWWDLITDNKIDGSFSSEVTDYYDSNTHDYDNYSVEETIVDNSRDNS